MEAHARSRSETRSPLLGPMRKLRLVDGRRGLRDLAIDWLTIAAAASGAVLANEARLAAGWPAWASVPIFAVAIVLIGGGLHRLAGLGHEASHYILLRNPFWNDLVGDWFCFFPIWSCVHFYRLFHMAHHQYVNDPERDPDLRNMGKSKRVERFPMSARRFVLEYWLRPITSPWSFAWFQGDYLYVNVLGKGGNVYMDRVADGDGQSRALRLGTWLGLAYVLGLNAGLWALSVRGLAGWVLPASAVALAVALAVLAILPRWALFQSPFRQPYSPRSASALRLVWFTLVIAGAAWLRELTGGRSVAYVSLLYIVPMVTTFPLFLLLRDVYQHANSDDDRITNTRVFRTDPFSRWAIFVHGQDLHTPHHLHPAVPYYHLEELHALLRRQDARYADRVIECVGTFRGRGGSPTILDVLGTPREGPSSS